MVALFQISTTDPSWRKAEDVKLSRVGAQEKPNQWFDAFNAKTTQLARLCCVKQ